MENEQVLANNQGGVAVDATSAGGVTQTVTPTPQPQDAKSVENRPIEEVRKVQEDLNRMKSTFQRKEAEREREWQQKEAEYRRQIEEVRLSNMDEEQRKVYEQTSAQRRYAETQRELEETRNRLNTIQAMREAEAWFIEQGVPVNELVRDADYDSLWTSGMGWITSELQKAKNSTGNQVSAPPPPKQAPAVDTQTGASAYNGTTWTDLVKRYGSEDNVYRLIETGQLPASILPGLQ